MTARALAATLIAAFISIPSSGAVPATPSDPRDATVLCYHIVESPQDARMEISREIFRQHLQYLEMTGYNVIPLRHLYEYVSGARKSIPRNAVVITLDDGWRSTYTEAFPELKKRGFPFTVFIYPNIIGQTANAMTWEQVKEMADAGVDIQSHSLSHPFLTRRRHMSISDNVYTQWLQREMSESKRILEKQTGRKVRYIAYPYGDYDKLVVSAASKAGYEAALTCEFGRVRKGSDPLRMKRYVIDKRMNFAEFRRYMGASPIQLAQMIPAPAKSLDAAQAVISARIPNFKTLDPKSVGLALLGLGSTLPYSYDATTGEVTMVLRHAISEIKGHYHRAVVWATDTRTGKRVEGTWTFRFTDPAAPVPAEAPGQLAGGESLGASPAALVEPATARPTEGTSPKAVVPVSSPAALRSAETRASERGTRD